MSLSFIEAQSDPVPPDFPRVGFNCQSPDVTLGQETIVACESLTNFIPTENTPIKTVRIAFHVFQLSGSNPGNFRAIPAHENFLRAVFDRVNAVFTRSSSRACFCTWEDNGFVRDSRIRFDLTGIYFHQDDQAHINFDDPIYAPQIHNKYKDNCPYKEEDVLNVYFTQASTEFGGIGPPDYVHIPRLYDIYNWAGFERYWPDGNNLAHEIGHTLGLSHSWVADAAITDLCPNESRCDFGCPVSGGFCSDSCNPASGCSNNVMNYSVFETFFSPLQMAKMNRTLTIGRQKRWIAKRTEDLVDETINGTITWDQTRYQGGDVIIKPGAELTISACRITMAPGTKIIVERGARLIVDGARIQGTSYGNRHACNLPNGNTRWRGVQVWGNTQLATNDLLLDEDFPLQATDPGVVVVKNGSIIEGAEKGILNRRTAGSWEVQKEYFGGLRSVENSTFLNCFKGVEMIATEPLSNASVFEGVTFKQDYLNPSGEVFNSATSDYYGLTSWQVGGFELNNCRFEDLEAGIVLLNKNFTVTNSVFERCEKGVMNGSLLLTTALTEIGQVDQSNEFTNCRVGVDLASPKNVNVSDNVFVGNNHGAFASGPSNFILRDNSINSNPIGNRTVTAIMLDQLSSIGPTNQVSCNQIGNTDAGREINYGTYLSGSVQGVAIVKNDYNARYDWYLGPVYHPDGSLTRVDLVDQGGLGSPVYNNFTVKTNAGSAIQINVYTPRTNAEVVGNFNYWHEPVSGISSRLVPECPLAWTGTNWDNCGIKYNFINQETTTDEPDNDCSFGEITGFQSSPDCKSVACIIELGASIALLKDSIRLSNDNTISQQVLVNPNASATLAHLMDSIPYASEELLLEALSSGMSNQNLMDVLLQNAPLSLNVMQAAQEKLAAEQYSSLLAQQQLGELSLPEVSEIRLNELRAQRLHSVAHVSDSLVSINQSGRALELLSLVGGKPSLQRAISNAFIEKNYELVGELVAIYPQSNQDDKDFQVVMAIYLGTLSGGDGFDLEDSDLDTLKELAESRRKYASYAQLLLTGYYDVHFYPQLEEEKEPEKRLDSQLGGEKQITTTNKETLKIYPNPSAGTINLEASEGSIIQDVELYNLYGSKLPVNRTSSNLNKIIINNLSPGVYFIRCSLYGVSKVKKVIVQ